MILSSKSDFYILQTTLDDHEKAKQIAHILVEEKLAACVNLSQVGLSTYVWHDKIQSDQEFTLSIKTTQACIEQCSERVINLHPYDVPELIVIPIIGGHKPYLEWLRQNTCCTS